VSIAYRADSNYFRFDSGIWLPNNYGSRCLVATICIIFAAQGGDQDKEFTMNTIVTRTVQRSLLRH
jgi:hypothetical protein